MELRQTPAAVPMLGKEARGPGGRLLLREDTVLADFRGCAGCGTRLTCSVRKHWSVLCWGRHSDKKYYTLPMLGKEARGPGGRLLLREDTVLADFRGCAGCGTRLTCSVRKHWSVLCWGRHSDKKYYTLPMLGKEARGPGGRLLLREDTVLADFRGCAGCGTRLTCSVRKHWSVLCWGRHSDKKYYTCMELRQTPAAVPMLGKEARGPGGRLLLREDTVLADFRGCAGCGTRLTCSVRKHWSVLCWGRHSDKKYYTLLVLLSATFVLSLIGTVFFCFTNTINDAILSNMVIRNNSLAYKVWQRPNVQPHMKVHIFNYTNWERVRDGLDDRLRVEDIGPYVYSQQVERVNVEFEQDTVTFQEKNDFRYIPNKSEGAPFDQIIVPNMPLLGLAKVVETKLNAITQIPILSMLSFANHPNAFVQLPLHRFLWGYEDSIFDAAKPWLSLRGELKFNKFGLLSAKNDTLSEKLTINTGEVDMDKMNVIVKVEGKSQLDLWTGECNSIKATDGSIFPPSLLENRAPLYVFYPNLCRRLPFLFEQEVELDGIPLLRYRLPETVFDDPTHNPDNQCFCEIDTPTCPPRGVINVTACTMGAPALVSFPHFNHGDEKLRHDILGLHPDSSIHENYLDIHPTLGIALRGKSSLQINMQVRKATISALGFLEQGLILPIAWIEMAVDDLPESLRTLIYHGTFSTAAAQLGLAVTSVMALLVSGICLLTLLVGRRNKPCATVKIPLKAELNNQTIK